MSVSALTRAAPQTSGLSLQVVTYLAIAAVAVAIPFFAGDFWPYVATRFLIYWTLIAGLNLIVGYAGHMAIGYVAVLAVGSYAASIAANLLGWGTFASMGLACVCGAMAGLIIGLPAMRLKTFYFAMATLGATQIVVQVALAWTDVTGGGMGILGPLLPQPFDSGTGFYYFCLAAAAVATVVTINVAFGHHGRTLVALRDAEVAAESCGISKARALYPVFLLAGGLAGVAGTLFAAMQTHINPEAFNFDLAVLFFVAILVGGRGSIIGPFVATAVLTVLPELAAPLAAWSTFIHAAVLLGITLLVPGGIAELWSRYFGARPPVARSSEIRPHALSGVLGTDRRTSALSLSNVAVAFGGFRAVDGVSLDVQPGEIHGLIGPNGSGKTTTLNLVSGFVRLAGGEIRIGDTVLRPGSSTGAPKLGIARTFQNPRVIGEATALENVMIGGSLTYEGSLVEAMLQLPRHRRSERRLRDKGMAALEAVGLADVANVQAERLQHNELRLLEIARALMGEPRYLLLDEPAAGLSHEEIASLARIVRCVSREHGVGVIVVEHHAEFIFDVCDRITVLHLGKVLAAGTSEEVRRNQEVIDAYLGV